MALAVHVPGATLVKIDAGEGSGIEQLGYSIDGIDIEEDVFFGDVPGDQNGGSEGPPIDIQYFGEIARIRMELSNFDDAVLSKIRAKVSNGTAGLAATSGSLMSASSLGYRVILVTTSSGYEHNFPFAIPRQPIVLNSGTKFRRAIIDWEAHSSSGTVWNQTLV